MRNAASVVTATLRGDAASMPHRLAIVCAVCMFCGLCSSASALAAPAPLPWKAGDVVGSRGGEEKAQWRVTSWDRKLEFIRIDLARDDGSKTRVEVRYGSGKPSEYATELYAVQPAPDVKPDLDAIGSVLADLRAWQKQPGHVPFVAAAAAKKETPKRSPPVSAAPQAKQATWSTPQEYGWGRHVPWLALNILAIALFFVAVPCRAPALIAFVAGCVVLLWFRGEGLPIQWVNSLQEGGTGPRIEALYGHGIHAGPNHASVANAITGGHGYSIAHLAGLNVALWVVSSLLFAAWSIARGGMAIGIAMTALFAFNGNALQTSTSELPAGLVIVYVMMLVASGLFAGRPAEYAENKGRDEPRLKIAARIGLVAAVSVLLWGTRTETIAIGAAVGAALAWDRFGAVNLACIPSTPTRKVLIAAIVAVAGWLILPVLGRAIEPMCHEHWCYAVRAMQGEDLGRSLLWLPGFLVGTAMPVGIGLLLLAAFVRIALAPLAVLGIGVATVALYRVYFVAGHGITIEHYELYRYAAVFAPLCVILCTDLAASICESTWWASQSGRTRLGIWAAAGVSMVIFPGATSDYDPPWGRPMARNQQIEARILLATARNHSKCAVVSLVAAGGPGADARTEWALFGGESSNVTPSRYPPDQLDLLLSDTRHVECTLFYRGLDCASIPGVCDPYTKTPAVDTVTFASARYLADHFARPPAEGQITVSLHPFDPPSAGRP